MRRRWNGRGFSVAELMVVLVIIGVAMIAMAPQFAKVWRRSDLEIVASRMETRMKICRQKAVLNRKPYRITIRRDDKYFFSERRDSVGVWVMDPPDTLFVDHAISFQSFAGGAVGNQEILFETRGTVSRADAPATVRFWNSRGETLSVNLVRTGRVRVTRKG